MDVDRDDGSSHDSAIDLVAEGRRFHHPFVPYEVQVEFMRSVWDCCENGRIGVLESPTGTGKSLSLICGSLSWLRGFQRRSFETAADPNDDEAEPDWILDHARQEKKRIITQRKAELESRLAKARALEDKAKARFETRERPAKRQRSAAQDSSVTAEGGNQFLLDDYESDGDDPKPLSSTFGLSADTEALLAKLKGTESTSDEESSQQDELKVFYCSRTHSQLSQFVSELKRVQIPPATEDQPDADGASGNFKQITLGSRKTLCINSKVNQLGNVTSINERCLELQQPGISQDQKCQYLPRKDNEALIYDFRDHALSRLRDIEELGAIGKRIGICPYYASRTAIKPTEIVTLPYQLLLQKSAREALDLSLKGNVVIIDEAHNLIDTISNIHSKSLSLHQLRTARSQLGVYLQRFRNRLRGKNRVYLAQVLRVIDSLSTFLDERLADKSSWDGQVEPAELLAGKSADQINLYKLMNYLQESKLARKVQGYSESSEALSQRARVSTSTPVLMQVQSFLLTLTNPAAEGKFFYSKSAEGDSRGHDIVLKYLLLDTTHHFREIVEEARAVVLAGGTMSPMTDYTSHLFSYLQPEKIKTLSCGHVIPAENLTAIVSARGADGLEFDFTFEKRKSPQVMRELGNTIAEYARIIPDGLVVFLPSYEYLHNLMDFWKQGDRSLIKEVSRYKRIFMEPKSGTNPGSQNGLSSVDQVLSAFSEHIHDPDRSDNGALLFAVIGGSLSEGINFSDRLGRGVVVVGLPFPNSHSAEWKAKLEFIEHRVGAHAGKEAARDFYENACMRAVNQSIGRAIRHQKDYAAIILIDRRYESERIASKLPGWIKKSLVRPSSKQDALVRLQTFYELKS